MTLQKTAKNLTIATGIDTDDEDETSHYENQVPLSTKAQTTASVVLSNKLASQLSKCLVLYKVLL
jgi:hypothetical protein